MTIVLQENVHYSWRRRRDNVVSGGGGGVITLLAVAV